MSAPLVIRNLAPVFSGETLLPTFTRYNRLESRPRTDNFNRALRAEIRDALWMICKQWQMGEFLGDDAGTPVAAKVHIKGQQIAKYKPNGNDTEVFDLETPLEGTVERRPIPFQAGELRLALDLRLQMGRRWLKMIPAGAADEFKNSYPIVAPDPPATDEPLICAHVEAWQQFQAVAGRAMDGAALYFHLKENPANLASDGVAGLTPSQKAAADSAGPLFVEWFEKLYLMPDEGKGNAWLPERLEYQFGCGVPDGEGGEKVLTAEGYYQERIDWFSFDWDKSQQTLGDAPGAASDLPLEKKYVTQSFIPAPVRFNGMPDTRWWAFEDGKTNFGDIKPSTTDLAKLLLMEFGLVYANDWFLLPYTVPIGSALNIEGFAVTNTFGERFWIEAAGRGSDDSWQRWAMFALNIKGTVDEPADLTLLVLPTVPKIQESSPLEEVAFIRDEMANMVWGIETVVPMAHGWSREGNIAAAELDAYLRAAPPPPEPFQPKASFRYNIMTTVPENWIPFVPEHVPNNNRQIQLRRAAMPRYPFDLTPNFKRVRPRTTLLREGLDANQPYYIHEEEVPRAGMRVAELYQRTRWKDGKVFIWLGISKNTGRGEGHSGLAFDQIVPVT
jgi:hypothetical protein